MQQRSLRVRIENPTNPYLCFTKRSRAERAVAKGVAEWTSPESIRYLEIVELRNKAIREQHEKRVMDIAKRISERLPTAEDNTTVRKVLRTWSHHPARSSAYNRGRGTPVERSCV